MDTIPALFAAPLNKPIMRKNIDIPDEIVKPLKILAIEADKDLKNYIQDLLVAHTGKYKKK